MANLPRIDISTRGTRARRPCRRVHPAFMTQFTRMAKR